MARPKRGEQIPPPSKAVEWDLRYGTKESLGLPELEKQFPGNVASAKKRLRIAPAVRSEPQKPLKGTLGTRTLRGVRMPQWQYDISSAARVWYCIDAERHTVWLTLVAFGHPKATVSKGRGRSVKR
jgi:hypothetical protein